MSKFERFRSTLLELEGLDMRTELYKPPTGLTVLNIWFDTRSYLDNPNTPDKQYEFDILQTIDIGNLNTELLELWQEVKYVRND